MPFRLASRQAGRRCALRRTGRSVFGAAADQGFGDLLGVERGLRLRVDRDDRLLLADGLAHLEVAQDDAGQRRTEAEEGLRGAGERFVGAAAGDAGVGHVDGDPRLHAGA